MASKDSLKRVKEGDCEFLLIITLLTFLVMGTICNNIVTGLTYGNVGSSSSEVSLTTSSVFPTHVEITKISQSPLCKKACDINFCIDSESNECIKLPGVILDSCPSYQRCLIECETPCYEELNKGDMECFFESDLSCVTSQ